jgi:arylsulfatase A-like enzyme/Flp pilus assembly protein TadD
MSLRKGWLLVVTLILLAGCSQRVDRPSVLLVILDTTRADVLGAYGGEVARTPTLDRLAREGLLFLEAEAQNPYTLGSVATILASLPPDVHGLRGNSGFRLSQGATTLAEVFSEAGYRTAAFVSAIPLRRETGCDQGYETYDDDFSMPYPVYDAQYLPIREARQGAERRGDVTVARAVEWLDQVEPPFFLTVHLYDPHQPYDPPPPFQERYRGRPYEGEVAYADSLVGAVLEALRERGWLEKTVVCVVGDHGEAFKEHEEVGHGFLLYETTLRVPWILWGPGIPRAVVAGPVPLMDLAPTLLRACGLEPPETFMGRSHWPVPEGDTVRIAEEPFYLETYYPRVTHRWSELLGWRRGPWKFVKGPGSELFRLDTDPGEETNLLAAEPDTARAMEEALSAYLARAVPAGLGPERTRPDEETLEKLRSLGYVGEAEAGDEFSVAGWELGLPDPKEAIVPWNRRQESRAFYRLALVAYDAGQPEDALKWAEQSLERDPEHLDALLVRARSLSALGRLQEAIQVFRDYLEARPQDTAGWIGLGIVWDKAGDVERARAAYAMALQLNPRSPEANFNMGSLLLRTGNEEAALPYYETVRELEPQNVPLRADLARIYLRLGRQDEARSVLEEAYAVDPTYPTVLVLLGGLEAESGNVDRASELLRDFLQRYPNRPEAEQIREALRRFRSSG